MWSELFLMARGKAEILGGTKGSPQGVMPYNQNFLKGVVT